MLGIHMKGCDLQSGYAHEKPSLFILSQFHVLIIVIFITFCALGDVPLNTTLFISNHREQITAAEKIQQPSFQAFFPLNKLQ